MKPFKMYVYLTIGTLLAAIAVNLFIASNHLVFGGVSGIGIVLQALFKLPLSITNLAINIPLFLIGGKLKGRDFLIKSLYATATLSLFLKLTDSLYGDVDLIVAAIFGGSLLGCGVGLVIHGGGSTGGTDMAALLINKVTQWPISRLIFIIDACVIATGIFFFGLNRALYAIVVVACLSNSVNITIKFLQKQRINAKQPSEKVTLKVLINK